MHEPASALPEIFGVFEEPSGEHRREHAAGIGVARLLAPYVETHGVYGVGVALGPGIQIVDERRHGIAVLVHAGYPADDPVAHDGADRQGIQALGEHLLGAFADPLDGQTEVLVRIHLDTAWLGIAYRGRVRDLCDAFPVAVIDGDLDALCAGIESEIVSVRHVIRRPTAV